MEKKIKHDLKEKILRLEHKKKTKSGSEQLTTRLDYKISWFKPTK